MIKTVELKCYFVTFLHLHHVVMEYENTYNTPHHYHAATPQPHITTDAKYRCDIISTKNKPPFYILSFIPTLLLFFPLFPTFSPGRYLPAMRLIFELNTSSSQYENVLGISYNYSNSYLQTFKTSHDF